MKLDPLSDFSSLLVIYCLIKLILCSTLKIWLLSHCLIKLISCPAPRLPLLWHSQRHSWRSKQGTCGTGIKALCRRAHVSPSLPSDPRGGFFPAHHDLTLGRFLVGALRTVSHIPDGRWGEVRWAEREASLPPRGHLRVLHFVSAPGELLAFT